MTRAGFEPVPVVRVVVDEMLPIIGYSSWDESGYAITLSPAAIVFGPLDVAMVHELSHVYRHATGHLSHNRSLVIAEVASFIARHGLSEKYQRSVLARVVNHIQDLYADDIAVRVLSQSWGESLIRELADAYGAWTNETPLEGVEPEKSRWENAALMLNNCFLLSDLERHGLENALVKRKSEAFLCKVSPDARKEFYYFRDLMLNLAERPDRKSFKAQLNNYLENFLVMTQVN